MYNVRLFKNLNRGTTNCFFKLQEYLVIISYLKTKLRCITRFIKSPIIARNLDVSDTTADEKRDGRRLSKMYSVFRSRSCFHLSFIYKYPHISSYINTGLSNFCAMRYAAFINPT